MASVAPSRRRSLAPLGHRVADDDRRGAGQARALHDRQADAAEAHHQHRGALLHPRGVEHRTPTPVCTAQPSTQATSSGTSSGILTAPVSWVITVSAKAATPTPR